MTFPSFPQPKLSTACSCSHSIVKTIIYLKYFLTLKCIKCVLVFFSTEIKVCFQLVLFFSVSYQFRFLKFYSHKAYCFSITSHDPQLNSMTFQAWKLKL